MARNPIQFQKGLSESAFLDTYGTEEQCTAALEAMRWPEGFRCPRCDHDSGYRLPSRPRLTQCAHCSYQASVTAGTVFHRTRLPLTTWFRAIYHLTQSKNGIAALELMRRLGVNYDTAWKIKHKLMEAMAVREAHTKLDVRVEIDDAYLGGERPRRAGKSGRGAEGKTPFIAAVETDTDGRPQRMVMEVVEGFTLEAVRDFASRHLLPSADVYSDGLNCFPAVIGAGCSHTVCVTGGGRRAAEKPAFRWVNTTLGNIKSALVGTYRHLSGRHARRYLGEFQYRFNRRNDVGSMVRRLAWVALRMPPVPYAVLKQAESRG